MMTDWTTRMQNDELEYHPLCTLFPRITGDEKAALVADIKANGLREPIVLLDGMVLDGGNRYAACLEAGVEPHFVGFTGGDAVAFVLSANLHRRHLTAGQHAAIVASITNWADANQRGGRRATDAIPAIPLSTVAERAKASGTSERTQRTADRVAKADPSLVTAVAQGEITLAKAVETLNEGKPKTERQLEAEQANEDAFEGVDTVKELEDAHAEIAALQARIDAITSDSPQGKILSLTRAVDAANRSRDEAKTLIEEHKKRAKWGETQLKRIGRLVGESELEKIADAIELALKKAA